MKTVTLIIFCSLSLFGSSIDLNACKGCHGQNFEKKALGKSNIVKNLSSSEIEKSLNGYKDGSYGGSMSALMKGQVGKYSDNEIKTISNQISPKKGSIQKGKKIILKKLKSKISLNGTKLAMLHTSKEWNLLFSNNAEGFIKEFSQKYPKLEKYLKSSSFKKNYIHLKAFLVKYSSDSGNIPSC